MGRAVKETIFQARMKFNDSLMESYAFRGIFAGESLRTNGSGKGSRSQKVT